MTEPRNAASVALAPGATTVETFTAVMAECNAHWRANAPVVLSDRAPEALHQTRVGIRRLRSALSLFGRALDDPQVPWLKDEIRTLALPLGEARDLDVFLAGNLAPALDAELHALVASRRDAAYDTVTALLSSRSWQDTWSLLDRFLDHAPWGADPQERGRDRAVLILERRWRRLLRRGAALDALTPTERHRVRIEGKKLRYGIQFLADLFPDAAGTPPTAFADELGLLQDALGVLNDVHTQELILASVGAPRPEVDTRSLVQEAVRVMGETAALQPFWRSTTG